MTDVAERPVTEIVAGSVEEVRLALQLEMIDKAVRAARNGGWCEQFERTIGYIFPDGHPLEAHHAYGNPWLDSDGFDCRGYDHEGFNAQGINGQTGRDREGYDAAGFNRQGWNRDGFNRYGYNSDGRDREGFNAEGIHADGYDRAGNPVDSPEHQDWLYRFDQNGYDVDGFNAAGFHQQSGLNREAHANRFRHDRNGFPRPAAAA